MFSIVSPRVASASAPTHTKNPYAGLCIILNIGLALLGAMAVAGWAIAALRLLQGGAA